MFDPQTLLHVEDDDNYAMLFECTLRQGGFKHIIHRVNDGAEAILYLKGEGKYADRSSYKIPFVVLADLKMPKVNGFQLLTWIRHDSANPRLPVVVLTSSDELRDVQTAYTMGANSFLVKPPRIEDLGEMLKMIDGYWRKFNVVEPPLQNQPSADKTALRPGAST